MAHALAWVVVFTTKPWLLRADHRPFRLGLAHHFQLVPQRLIRETWDQPLDGLLTPQQHLRFKR